MLKIFVAAKPVYLRGGIPINDITLVILEIPGHNNKDISFTDPYSFLNLAFDPP